MANRPGIVFNADVIAEFRAKGGKVGRPWRPIPIVALDRVPV